MRLTVFNLCMGRTGDPSEEDLIKIRTRKPERPVIEVNMHDGSTRRLWCTFGPQQIDIDPFSKPGVSPPPSLELKFLGATAKPAEHLLLHFTGHLATWSHSTKGAITHQSSAIALTLDCAPNSRHVFS